MSLAPFLWFSAGAVLLIVGAELLVRGASRLAGAVGISPLVIGLTVVAFGTSAPEAAVSVDAALTGRAEIALGNVIGSNIFNVLFILGLSALIVPLVVSQRLVRLDVPLLIGASVLLFIMALDGRISRIDGALLFAGILAYVVWSVRLSREESEAVRLEYEQQYGARAPVKRPLQVLAIIAGLVLLVLGARWLVDAAVTFARLLEVSELIIGLTIVAAGTSLPEVATSVLAAVRGERDIAVGNVVGSSIFNILAVLGLASLAAPGGIAVSTAVLGFDLPVMIAVALACLPIFFTGRSIARWEGALFLGYYIAYAAYLILGATGHDALPAFSAVMLKFVLPLTVITLLVLFMHAAPRRT
jgi:cation:H+ antiporter